MKCCPLQCHVSHSAIRTLTTGWLWCVAQPSVSAARCNRGDATLLISTSVHKTLFVPPLRLSKSLSSLPLKGKWMCKYISHANPIMEHMLRQLCDYNQAACEKCLVWRLLLDLSLTCDSTDLKSHPVLFAYCFIEWIFLQFYLFINLFIHALIRVWRPSFLVSICASRTVYAGLTHANACSW